MNLYYIDAGGTRFFSNKMAAEYAAQEEADKIQKGVIVSKMFVAIDRDNVARMANGEIGFSKFVGRVGTVHPRKRPKLKLKRVAAALVPILLLLLLSPADAANCSTRRSGSVTTTSCSGKPFNTHCRSYRSGSVTRTHCS